jgi:tetratricopeptide (TPR) repeat protein
MRARRWALAIGLIAGVLSSAGVRAAAADDFDQERLREGRMAFQQKRFDEAINQFRVAAFGSLDDPAVLTECLARLALAQSAAGKTAETDETLNRFVEVERRFGGFAKANLEPDVRAEFQALLKKRIAPATLAGISSLGAAPEGPAQSAARSAPAAPPKASAPKPSAPPPSTPEAVRAPAPAEATGPTPADRSRQALSDSRRLINASRAGEAERILSQALSSDPGNRDLHLSLLEASCLNRSYATSIAQLPSVTPFGEGESVSMFYAAVALYEVGRVPEARDLMRRADSRVSGPLVDEYAKKIMGQP